MLQNAYFLAKIGADTAENEQQFAEILPIDRRVADRRRPDTENTSRRRRRGARARPDPLPPARAPSNGPPPRRGEARGGSRVRARGPLSDGRIDFRAE